MADSNGDSADFAAACALGQLALVAQRLAANPALAQARAPDGKTPLHLAAQWGQLEIAQVLLGHGADPNAIDNDGRAPVHVMTGHATRLELLDLLTKHGADLNLRDQDGNSPLFLAASQIHQAGFEWAAHDWLTEALLKHGAHLDAFTAVILNREGDLRAMVAAEPALLHARKRHGYIPDGSTLLHFAADRGHGTAAKALLDLGADVLATDVRGRPPLYLAGHNAGARKAGPTPEVVELLIAAGAPLDVFAAALLGRLDDLQRLVNADPALVLATDAGGSTPLHLAAWNGQLETARWLLDKGAAVDAGNARGETALSLAAGYQHAAVVELLLARGATCPLFTAITLARPDLLSGALAAEPAAAAAPNRYGSTPAQATAEAAHWAFTFGNLDGFERQKENLALLSAHGAPAEIWSAIVLDQASEVERLLCEKPGLINLTNNGQTPLHLAAALGRAALAELLVKHGAALEARDYAGATPLRRAAGFVPGVGHGDAATTGVLLRHGSRIDSRNNWSDTPAGVALATPAVAELMLAHGAEMTVWAAAALGRRDELAAMLAADAQLLTAQGTFGFTPLNWAVANGHTATVEYLLDRGAPLDTNTWGRSLLTWANLCGQPAMAELLRGRGLAE